MSECLHPAVWPTVLDRKLENFSYFADFRCFLRVVRNFIRSEVVSSWLLGQKVTKKVLLFGVFLKISVFGHFMVSE